GSAAPAATAAAAAAAPAAAAAGTTSAATAGTATAATARTVGRAGGHHAWVGPGPTAAGRRPLGHRAGRRLGRAGSGPAAVTARRRPLHASGAAGRERVVARTWTAALAASHAGALATERVVARARAGRARGARPRLGGTGLRTGGPARLRGQIARRGCAALGGRTLGRGNIARRPVLARRRRARLGRWLGRRGRLLRCDRCRRLSRRRGPGSRGGLTDRLRCRRRWRLGRCRLGRRRSLRCAGGRRLRSRGLGALGRLTGRLVRGCRLIVLERFSQPADDGSLYGRGRRFDVLAEVAQLAEDVLARYAELFGELVYPDLCHCSPSRPGRVRLGPARCCACSSLRAHRALVSVTSCLLRS